jgi:hypothetical protein
VCIQYDPSLVIIPPVALPNEFEVTKFPEELNVWIKYPPVCVVVPPYAFCPVESE